MSIVDDVEPSGPSIPLQLRGITKTYRSQRETTEVLRNVDLELRRGEMACLLGASGSGKSTLISVMAGLIRPDAGEVVINGQDVGTYSDAERARLRATTIGLVLQSGNLVPFLTASENIRLARKLAGAAASRASVLRMLGEVGMEGRADQLPRRLSGGEAQRVALAMALANDPGVLLADEAVGQLDSATARQVLGIIEQACDERGLAVLLVTHSDEVAALASRTIRVVGGRLEEAT